MHHESQLEALLALYGREDDPLWNLRISPFLEEALDLAAGLGADSLEQVDAFARLVMGRRHLAELAVRARVSQGTRFERYPHLLSPEHFNLDTRPFGDPLRFLTPGVHQHLRPLLARLGEVLDVAPELLDPSAFTAPQVGPVLAPEDAALRARLQARLEELEPYAPLEDLVRVDGDDVGALFWPRYRGQETVFGGAQYLMAYDGGLLCAPQSFSLAELSAAYRAGERTDPATTINPESAPETWARNSAPAARAVVAALSNRPDTSASGVLGHWERGTFFDGESLRDMLAALDSSSGPTQVDADSFPSLVRSLPAHTHLLVAVRWKGWNRAHWFNVRNNGASSVWIDGQSGASGAWPPPFLERAESELTVLKPPSPRSRWAWRR